MNGGWRRQPGSGLAGVMLSLLLSVGAAAGQSPELEALRARLERLERQNDRLERQNEELRQLLLGSLPQTGADAAMAPDAKAVQQIVADYLKEQDRKKREEADKKKTEAEEKGYVVGSDPSFKASWTDGMLLESPNKDFRVHVGGRVQNDWAWFSPDAELENAFPGSWQDGADFRRLRLRVDGSCWEVIDWVTEIEFATAVAGTTNHPVPTNAYFNIRELPLVGNFRAGQMKEPFSLDFYGTSSRYLIFLERSAAQDAFDPQRNVGMMVLGTFLEERVTYASGFFRTNSNEDSGNAFDYADAEYSYTSRLTFNPVYENEGRCVVHFGGAYSHRMLDPDVSSSRFTFASRAPVRVGSPVLVSTDALQADSGDFYNVQAAAVCGPLAAQGEWFFTQVNNLRRGVEAPGVERLLQPAFDGGYVQVSYFLTGEHHPYRRDIGGFDRVHPHEPFFFVRRGEDGGPGCTCLGKGAWEVAVRYDYLNVGSPALAAFPAIPGVPNSGAAAVATRGILNDFVIGLNWYLNPNFKVQWNYVHAWRLVPDPAASSQVDTFAMRFAFDF